MPIRWIAIAGVLVLAGVPALTACSATAGHQVGADVSSQSARGTTANGSTANGVAKGAGPAAWSTGSGSARGSTTNSSAATSSTASSQPAPSGSGPVGGQVVDPTSNPSTNPGLSNAELAQIDQQLSDAANSLGAADADAAHNETGDATP